VPNRIIKESICTSRKINELSADEEVFYYRLLVNCDDYGCFFGDPDILVARLFPRKRIPADKVQRWRDKICKVGLARLYIDNDETYIEVSKWADNQQIRNHKRKFPVPTDLISIDINCNQLQSNEFLIQSNPIQSESNPNTNTASETDANVRTVKEPKNRYGEFQNVLLTAAQYEALSGKVPGADKLIDELSMYIQSKGVKYRDHYATLLAWHRRRTETNRPHGTERNSGRKSNEGNFSGRQYTDEDWAAMYTEPPEVTT